MLFSAFKIRLTQYIDIFKRLDSPLIFGSSLGYVTEVKHDLVKTCKPDNFRLNMKRLPCRISNSLSVYHQCSHYHITPFKRKLCVELQTFRGIN